jgi:hypothetical protein
MKKALLNMIGSRPVVEYSGPLVACSFNGYLLDGTKAERVIEPLMELIKRAHLILFQETNADAMHAIGKASGYGLNVSHRNNRGQANGILFHPRLHWLGDAPRYHDYGLEIPGHPEFKQTMRPALQRRVKDVVSGFIFDVINFHAKSNLGGPDETRPIRRVQFEMIIEELAKQLLKTPYKPRAKKPEGATDAAVGAADAAVSATTKDGATDPAGAAATPAPKVVDNSGEELPLGAVIMGGDFNAPIEKAETTEIEPLLKAGFVRVPNPENKWSYRYKEETGGQFDGFFARGMEGKVGNLWIPNFPDKKGEAWFYRELSDHLPVFVEIKV